MLTTGTAARALLLALAGQILVSWTLQAAEAGRGAPRADAVQRWGEPARNLAPDLRAEQQVRGIELVGQIGGETNAVAVQGSYAYVGVGPRLVVVDVSSPAAR